METDRIADYFVHAGIPLVGAVPLEDISQEAVTRPSHKLDPIVELAIINRTLGEETPPGFHCIEFTPYGLPADLNHGSIRAPEMYLCIRRGRDVPPLTDIGVLYEGKERVRKGCQVLLTTVGGRVANVNNANGLRIFLTTQRAEHMTGLNMLVVTDICVIIASKGELPPHAFLQIPKGLNKGMIGSDVYLCYKKSAIKGNSLVYKPGIISRYPLTDYADFSLPVDIATFCLPLGAMLECCAALSRLPEPSFYTFVLTLEGGTNAYGATLMFYEEVQEEMLSLHQKADLGLVNDSSETKSQRVYQSKSISLLSRWPFFDTFQKFLTYIYRLSITGPHSLPIERHISHFMNEVPFPAPSRSRIHVQLSADEDVLISLPEETPLPQNGASFVRLLRNLSPENCVLLLLHTLLEHKIIIHSLRPDVLTGVAEAVRTMIFPFHWQCPYIPLCPLSLSYVLNAPCPFIVGIDSRYFDLYEPPSEVVFVDLDTNTICTSPEMETALSKMIPRKPAQVLKAALEKIIARLASDVIELSLQGRLNALNIEADIARQKKRAALENATQEAFLMFMAIILKGYSNYLKPIIRAPNAHTTDLNSLFDSDGFLKSRDKSYQKFFQPMMKTQIFARFIEERSFVSEKDSGLAVFDDCIKKLEEGNTDSKLIEIETNSQNTKTVYIMSPDASGLTDGAQYSYYGFPPLKSELFASKKQDDGASLTIKTTVPPASPMTKRTKQELRVAQKTAQKEFNNPELWAKCLLWHTYSIWFIHLPSYVNTMKSKTTTLRAAYDILVRMHNSKLVPLDEVCYRVLMQMYGQYHQPALAVHVLSKMKSLGIQPNAVTYGLYNKAVLESAWHSVENRAFLYWTKLRNVLAAVNMFKRILIEIRKSRTSSYSSNDLDRISRASVDSYQEDVLFTPAVAVTQESMADAFPPQSDQRDKPQNLVLACGTSDGGYTSLDDTQLSSTVHGSVESLDKTSCASSHPLLFVSNDQYVENKGNKYSALDYSNDDSPATSILKYHDQPAGGRSIIRRSTESTSSTITVTAKSQDFSGSHQSIIATESTSSSTNNNDAIESSNSNHLSNIPLLHDESISAHDIKNNSDISQLTAGIEIEITKNLLISSPERQMRTPVTDNDPLGVFTSTITNTTASLDGAHQNESSLPVSSLPVSSLPVLGFGSVGALSQMASSDTVSHVPHSHTVAVVNGSSMYSSNDSLSSADHSFNNASKSPWKPSSWRTDKLGSALKFAASTVGSKLQKGWQQTVGKPEMGSTSSLNKTNGDNDMENAVRRQRAHSSQLDSRGSRNSLDDLLNTSKGAAKPVISRNVSLVSGFLSGIAQSSTFQGFSNKWEYMKGAFKESLVESMALSDDDLSSIGSYEQQYLSLNGNGSYEMDQNNAAFGHCKPLKTNWPSAEINSSMADSLQPNLAQNYQQGVERPDFKPSVQGSTRGTMSDCSSVQSLSVSTHNIGLDIEICSQSTCSSCSSLLYDEDIMAGWSAEDSNLNTSCVFCGKKVLPHLHIYIKDLRHFTKPFNVTPSQSIDSVLGAQLSAAAQSVTVHNAHAAPQFVVQGSEQPVLCDVIIEPSSDEQMGVNDENSPKECNIINSNDLKCSGDSFFVEKNNSEVSNESQRTCCINELEEKSVALTEDTNRVEFKAEDSRLQKQASLSPSENSLSFQLEAQIPATNVEDALASSSFSHENRPKCILLEPISVPYLSPLVLRKELETVISSEGDHCLNYARFIDEHPIIYWNLVYCFRRLDLPSHLPGLLLSAESTASCYDEVQKVWGGIVDSRHVCVRPVWDNMRLQEELGRPMYILWGLVNDQSVDASNRINIDKELVNLSLMEKIIYCIKENDVLTPINLLMNIRHEYKQRVNVQAHFHSMYRDILHLSFVVLGRDLIDHDAFDREYINAYQVLSKTAVSRTQLNDKPPTHRVQLCRHLFPDLPLS